MFLFQIYDAQTSGPYSGVFSTIFLWMVDVEESRKECEQFVKAESARKAFETSNRLASAFTGDADTKMT